MLGPSQRLSSRIRQQDAPFCPYIRIHCDVPLGHVSPTSTQRWARGAKKRRALSCSRKEGCVIIAESHSTERLMFGSCSAHVALIFRLDRDFPQEETFPPQREKAGAIPHVRLRFQASAAGAEAPIRAGQS